jgi:hypothetical protein
LKQDSVSLTPISSNAKLCAPQLQKIIVCFPSSTFHHDKEGFHNFEGHRELLWKGIGDFFRWGGTINAFELEDRRDWSLNISSIPHVGFMNIGSPRFRAFTTDLNKAFGFNCCETIEVVWKPVGPEHENQKLWEYEVTEIWKAGQGGHLAWNSETEEVLGTEQ